MFKLFINTAILYAESLEVVQVPRESASVVFQWKIEATTPSGRKFIVQRCKSKDEAIRKMRRINQDAEAPLSRVQKQRMSKKE